MEIVNLKGELKYLNNKHLYLLKFPKSTTLEKQELSFIFGKDVKCYITL